MQEIELAPKVKALYQAVIKLFEEGEDLTTITVADITGRAGIGKGTAYEYFSNKEEIIAGAIYQEIRISCRRLYEKISKAQDVREKAEIILQSMDHALMQTNCFFRALHVLMDNSAVGCRLKGLFQSKTDDDILVMELVQKFVTDETSKWEKADEQENSYLSMMLFSKIICYGMYLCGNQSVAHAKKPENDVMRGILCRGICEDFERSREKCESK